MSPPRDKHVRSLTVCKPYPWIPDAYLASSAPWSWFLRRSTGLPWGINHKEIGRSHSERFKSSLRLLVLVSLLHALTTLITDTHSSSLSKNINFSFREHDFHSLDDVNLVLWTNFFFLEVWISEPSRLSWPLWALPPLLKLPVAVGYVQVLHLLAIHPRSWNQRTSLDVINAATPEVGPKLFTLSKFII